jgi:hypothetical protein
MSKPDPREPAGAVRDEDVDEIIGIAAEMKHASADHLTVADLESVAAQLDIPAPYVQRAMSELAARRQAAEQARARRRRVLAWAGGALAATVVLTGVLAVQAQGSLREELSRVEQKRAQVRNVLERQAHVEARYRGAADSPERDAELSGAENRVSIERRRYDEAAARYNARARSFPASVWARLGGLPTRVPLSNEGVSW